MLQAATPCKQPQDTPIVPLRCRAVTGTISYVAVHTVNTHVYAGALHMNGQLVRYDIVIAGGSVLDGLGTPPVRADVGIVDDRIEAVGDLSEAQAARRIDASGRHVAPGFIDIHTHSDISATFHRQMLSMISQGVTTQVVGNCALSLGLALDTDAFAFERRWLGAHGSSIVWSNMRGHLDHVGQLGIATNYVMLAGHGTIRKRVMGLADRYATPDEIEAMERELALAMEQGAWGLSTGLEYTPSGYANLEELVALSRVAARYGGLYATHLRNEGDALLEAVQEALNVGYEAGIPVQLSHHKAEGRQNWGKVRQTIGMVEEARTRGVDVQMDQYPYTAYMTNVGVQFLPMWVLAGDNDAVVARLMDTETRAKVAAEMRSEHPDWDDAGPDGPWARVEIGIVRGNRALQGRTIADLAAEAGLHPIEYVLDLVVQERNFIAATNFAISEDDIAFVMRHDLTMIGSDAVGTGPDGQTGKDRVHPRCYGTFPRVLGRYVRENGVLTEAEAVRKMTSMPAERLGLKDRGRLAAGYRADIVIYDPATIRDEATYEAPHRYARGIDTVIVNGRVVWSGGAWTGVLPGAVLRRSAP
jgi:N-acyl-D-amino-acid deacylase